MNTQTDRQTDRYTHTVAEPSWVKTPCTCLHFLENCMALISINLCVRQQFIYKNDLMCHFVPLKNTIKNFFSCISIRRIHLFPPLVFPPPTSLRIHPGAAWRVVQFLRWRVKAVGLPRVLHHSSAILRRGNCYSRLKALIFSLITPKPSRCLHSGELLF